MRGLLAVFLGVAGVGALTVSAVPASAQDTLVLVKDIDRVEHLSLLEKLWKTVDNVKARALIAGRDWPELKTSSNFIGGVAVVHFLDTGFQDDGALEAPVGYTICHAAIKDPSVTCNGSMTAEYHIAADPDGKKIDGLHYSVTFERPNPAAIKPLPGRCWLYGTIVATFVQESKRSAFKCGQTGTVAFHYGSNKAKKDTN